MYKSASSCTSSTKSVSADVVIIIKYFRISCTKTASINIHNNLTRNLSNIHRLSWTLSGDMQIMILKHLPSNCLFLTVFQPRLIREDDTVPAVSHMHSFAHKCRRGGRFYKSSDIITIDFTTLMRKTTPPPTCTLTTAACHPHELVQRQ